MLNFDKIVSRFGVKLDEIRKKYWCYDLSFFNIKKIIDVVLKIVKDFEEMFIDKEKLMFWEKWVIV